MDDELIRLDVGAVAAGGSCVARHEGRVVFVRHALPGEVVLARVTESTTRYWRADAVEVLQASPDRVDPPCVWSGPARCGGCDWQHASLPAQRRSKEAVILEQFRRLAGLDLSVTVEEVPVPPIEPVESIAGESIEPHESDQRVDDGLGWRTRMRFAVDDQGRAGLRAHRSHEVVPIDHCPIAHPDIDAVRIPKRSWPRTAAVEVSVGADRQPLVIVEPVEGRRVDVPPLPKVSVARRTSAGLSRLRGRTWVEQQVQIDDEQVSLRVGHGGFWQVHPGGAQTLIDAVLETTDPQPGESTLDLYCGVGLFAAALAARVGPQGSVSAIEENDRSVADARRNLHASSWVHLHHGRVQSLLAGVLAGEPHRGRVDVAVLDPPRAGAGRRIIERLCAAGPRVIAYVACDPASLARDVAHAAEYGYQLTALRAFDLFPMTHHVECLATLRPTESA